jgi:antitoxin (DNA-binding transcriptional repressor) of toxin-antitoxin stability system
MRTVGIKALKNKLSAYIRAAAAGETILVTDRDEVVAQVSPPSAVLTKEVERNKRWQELIRQGVITPAKNPRSGPPRRLPGTMTFEQLMRELDEDRADR